MLSALLRPEFKNIASEKTIAKREVVGLRLILLAIDHLSIC